MQFVKAVKEQAKLRLALIAPAGCGKTYSALSIACALTPGKVALIDTEHGSAAKYADLFEFDTLQLVDFDPENYCEAIRAAEKAGYKTVVIDSLSHAWAGKGGALELVDKAAAKSKSGSTFHAWKDVTPKHQALIEAMLQSGCHVIATMRSKVEHVYENGKVKKIGMQPVQREGMEYEFDVVGDIDQDHKLIVSKSRIAALAGAVITKPGKQLAEQLIEWLKGAEPARRAAQGVEHCTAEQIGQIVALRPDYLAAACGQDATKEALAKAWADTLARYGVTSASGLTIEQANNLIAAMSNPAAPATTATAPVATSQAPTEAIGKVGATPAETPPTAPPGPLEMPAALVPTNLLEEITNSVPMFVASLCESQGGTNAPKEVRSAAWQSFLSTHWKVTSATKLTTEQGKEALELMYKEINKNSEAGKFLGGDKPTASQPVATAA